MSQTQKRAQKCYYLPEGYQCNYDTLTFNDGSGTVYWDEKRRKSQATYIFQFPVYAYIAKLAKEKNINQLVDVGCGVAAKLKHVHQRCPDLDIVGIDQQDAISFCKKQHDFGSWYVDNFDDPDPAMRDIKADLVVCSDVIEHVKDPDVLLSYLKKRVVEGGFIVLSTPDRVFKYGPKLNQSGHHSHVREWAAPELAAYLESQGFEVLKHFHQLPVKVGFSKVFLRETLNQIRSGNKLRYNQVCVLKVKS